MKQVPEHVSLEYREVGGQHTFRSTDYFGVYVADNTLRGAFDKIVAALESLVQIRTGSAVGYTPEETYEEFAANLQIGDDHAPNPSFILAEMPAIAMAN